MPRRARPVEVPGVGDKALLRIEKIDRRRRRRRLPGPRHQDHRPRQAPRARRVPQVRATAAGWSRSTRRVSAASSSIPAGAVNGAEEGDLVAVEVAPQRPARPADRAGGGTARLARQRKGGEPHRHPRPRHPPPVPPRGPRRGRGGAPRRPRRTARTGARFPSSPSIRSTPRTMTTRSLRGPTPIRRIPAASSSTSPSPMSPITSRRARRSTARRWLRGNSVYFPDRVVPMLPERISNDLCSLKPGVDRAAIAVRMVIGADGRKREHRFHRVLIRSLRQAPLRPGAGRHRRPARRHHRAAAGARHRAALRRLSRRSSAPATSAARSISICPSARSCSSPTTPSTG